MARRKYPDWWTEEDRAADIAARFGTPRSAGRPSGTRMKHPGTCERCGDPIIPEAENGVLRKGRDWIHPHCAPGGDDE